MSINSLFLVIKMILILWIVGYGFTAVFIPKNFRREAIFLCPIFGLVLISVLGGSLSFGFMPMYKGIYMIGLISLLLIGQAFLTKKSLPLSWKNNYPIFGVMLIPLFFFLSQDMSPFIADAEFLVKHTVFDTMAYKRTFLQNYSHIGVSSILAFFSALFHQKVAEITRVLPTVSLVLLPPMFFLLLKLLFPKLHRYLRTICILILLLILYLFFSWLNLGFQYLVFVDVFLLLFVLFYDYFFNDVSTKEKFYNFTNDNLLMAACLSSITAFYPFGFKLTLSLLVVFTIVQCFLKFHVQSLFFIMRTVFLTIIINPIIIGIILRLQ